MEDLLIEKLQNINKTEVINDKKEKQLQQYYNDIEPSKIKEFNNRIYKETTPENIKPKIQFVETLEEDIFFNYLRNITSSIFQNNIPGRVVKILVYDDTTKQYLGLLQLTVDLLINDEKSKYFGIEPVNYNKYKKKLRDNGANISICVPLQPFGFNFCGGKLLAMLAFSEDVYNYYYRKFNIKLKYLITLSYYGKSAQYSQLKQLKFIGYTSGYGTSHLSQDLLDTMKIYLEQIKVKNINKMSNHTIANNVIKHLKLEPDILKHNNKRGIYIGTLGSKEFIKNNKSNSKINSKTNRKINCINDDTNYEEWSPDLIETIETIYNIWLTRYAIKRKKHLIETQRFLI